MAETSATSWNSDQPGEDKRKLDTQLNTALKDFFTEEDFKGLNSDGGFTDEQLDAMLNGKGAQVAVIAKKGVKLSKMSDFLDISDTMGNTPIKIASNAWRELNPSNSVFQSLSEMPSQVPMVMADGHTRLLPIIVDPERSWVQTSNPRTAQDAQASLQPFHGYLHRPQFRSFDVSQRFGKAEGRSRKEQSERLHLDKSDLFQGIHIQGP